MRNIKLYKNIGFGLLTVMLGAVAWVAIVTHVNRNLSTASPTVRFFIENHLSIMVALMVTSVAFGFVGSSMSYSEIRRRKKDTKTMLDTILVFLSKEEREIVNFLVEKKGTTTQADVSRLPGMNRVKAHRSLQKMKEKNLLDITAHGKVRNIALKENIMNTLLEN